MLIIPAIDLLSSNVVRLEKGDMDKFKIYSKVPLSVAKSFEDMGVERLHIVDLDGAKKGSLENFDIIEKIVKNTSLSVDVGGGIRDISRAQRYFDLGVKYVTIGTIAVKDPETTKDILEKYPNSIILGIDARDGFVATDGWYENSNKRAKDLVDDYIGFKVASIIYTDISRDGMLTGINVDATVELSEKSPFPVIASGGLKSEKDIFELEKRSVYGCIVGKAFYEGLIDLKYVMKQIGK
ncbi:MAG: 1-(5-phosphoribosyl)-5-[(5-phosphoribosylamino)methylideneamino]imidazole-4-carboxamide isomerase [Calditerrivibrio sp.]|nr:1-(5-phosphoribosyl)-5-[(5-phosphoribosylamino)methylideneamino]imidazole-4-carboxamide isomerase [Calditerrivibrio sp.]